MKKILLLSTITIMIVVLLTGCGNKEKKYGKILEKYAKNYYEKYIEKSLGDQIDVPQITITNLKDANKLEQQYDLDKLKKCKDSSYVSFIMKNGEIESTEYHMNCK